MQIPYFKKMFNKPEKKILLSLLSILIILCSLAFFSHQNSSRVLRSAEEVDHAQEIKYHIEQLLAVSLDLETGARGYVITGDENYLEPTNKAIATIFKHLDHLKEITAGNKVQSDRILELENLIAKKVTNSTRTIETRRNQGLDQAIAFVSLGDNRVLMDKIRGLTDLMLQDEQIILNSKKEENHTDIRNFNIFFDLLLVKIAFSVIVIFFVLKYYFKQRKKSEELIRENKELLETVIDNTSSVIFIKDLAGKYILINNQFEKLFGITNDGIKGKTDYDIFPKEIADSVRHTDVEVITNKKLMEFEEDVPNNGEMHHYISIKFPMFDQDHMVYAVCGIATDITERKQSTRKIKARSDAIMDLFNNAPCGYHSVNKDLLIIEMNDTELKWLGYKREEVVGHMHLYALFAEESKKVAEKYRERLFTGKTESIHDLDVKYRRKDGSVFSVLLNSIAIYDQEGNFSHTKTSVFAQRRQAEPIVTLTDII